MPKAFDVPLHRADREDVDVGGSVGRGQFRIVDAAEQMHGVGAAAGGDGRRKRGAHRAFAPDRLRRFRTDDDQAQPRNLRTQARQAGLDELGDALAPGQATDAEQERSTPETVADAEGVAVGERRGPGDARVYDAHGIGADAARAGERGRMCAIGEDPGGTAQSGYEQRLVGAVFDDQIQTVYDHRVRTAREASMGPGVGREQTAGREHEVGAGIASGRAQNTPAAVQQERCGAHPAALLDPHRGGQKRRRARWPKT